MAKAQRNTPSVQLRWHQCTHQWKKRKSTEGLAWLESFHLAVSIDRFGVANGCDESLISGQDIDVDTDFESTADFVWCGMAMWCITAKENL